jgi:hypothetical protein
MEIAPHIAQARTIASIATMPFYLGLLLILGRWVLTLLTGNSPNNAVLKFFHTLTRPFYALAGALTGGRASGTTLSIVALLLTIAGIVLVQVLFVVWVVMFG